jgi:hypothetical protein
MNMGRLGLLSISTTIVIFLLCLISTRVVNAQEVLVRFTYYVLVQLAL